MGKKQAARECDNLFNTKATTKKIAFVWTNADAHGFNVSGKTMKNNLYINK